MKHLKKFEKFYSIDESVFDFLKKEQSADDKIALDVFKEVKKMSKEDFKRHSDSFNYHSRTTNIIKFYHYSFNIGDNSYIVRHTKNYPSDKGSYQFFKGPLNWEGGSQNWSIGEELNVNQKLIERIYSFITKKVYQK